jgi:hypothetical protein
MTEAACARVRPLAVRDDVGHRRVITRKPVGGAEAIRDLLPREGQRAARNLLL